LVSNGADVSIRYQYKKELEKQAPKVVTEEDLTITADRYGYIEGSEEAQISHNLMNQKEEKHQVEKERERAKRWAKMILNWDSWTKKKTKKV